MHLFVVAADLSRVFHLHPTRVSGTFEQSLPSLPAGRYHLFADIVDGAGFPWTGVGELELPELSCPALAGDDSAWSGAAADTSAPLADGGRVTWDRPPALRARTPITLRFRVEDAAGAPAADCEMYMGMAGHAAIVRDDLAVFAHLHPSGSVAMPALALAETALTGVVPPSHLGHVMPVPPEVSFPYGFPSPGRYHVFVQIKRAGVVQTAAFQAVVE
jgi:hypothetical protein